MEIVVLTLSSLFLFTFFIFIFFFFSSVLSTNQFPPPLSFSKAMEASKAEGKRAMKEVEKEEDAEDSRRKRALTLSERKTPSITGPGPGPGPSQPFCQVENCTADLKEAKPYHRRHKVCENHSKAPLVVVAGIRQRFCQQCSRFHDLAEFDEAKRSCRRRLAGHNERRRKSAYDSHGDG